VIAKHLHEIRDAIHGFIRVETDERRAIDSRPFQRLRHIHQLALTNLIYPGATHRRFEHSLGVMELAGRVYDIITEPARLIDEVVRDLVPKPDTFDHQYWRRVVRMAALCHDIGHLPFSHAAEGELLPGGWDHERITDVLIMGDEMKPLWDALKVYPEHVSKVALGPKKFGSKKHRTETFSSWEAILAEIIVGDAFGVDRIDYLLRDSHHAGVAYGKFDHFRLIDTLRILPQPRSGEPTLGIEQGGLHSAEALLLARFYMYTQLYLHHVRCIYDFHLKEFLSRWLPGGKFPTDSADHLARTDNEITAALLAAAYDPQNPDHVFARRIVCREHFRLLYQRNPDDVNVNPRAAEAIAEGAVQLYGRDNVHYYTYNEKTRGIDFPVLQHDGRVVSCLSVSDVLKNVPLVSVDYVFIAPKLRPSAEKWLAEKRPEILAPK
jgi:uncharacterized protein